MCMEPFRSKAAKTIVQLHEKAAGKPHILILPGHKSFTQGFLFISDLLGGKKRARLLCFPY